MLIEFLCPNGHRIHCDSQRSGLAAKCPKCGERFRVPTVAELEAAPPAAEGNPPPQPGMPTPPLGEQSAIRPGPATSADDIEFSVQTTT